MFWLDVLENLKTSLAMLLGGIGALKWKQQFHDKILGKFLLRQDSDVHRNKFSVSESYFCWKCLSLIIALKVLYFSAINSVVNNIPKTTEKCWEKCSLDLGSNLYFFFLIEAHSALYLHNFITTLYHAENIHVRVEEIWVCNFSPLLNRCQELSYSYVYISHTHCTEDQKMSQFVLMLPDRPAQFPRCLQSSCYPREASRSGFSQQLLYVWVIVKCMRIQ